MPVLALLGMIYGLWEAGTQGMALLGSPLLEKSAAWQPPLSKADLDDTQGGAELSPRL